MKARLAAQQTRYSEPMTASAPRRARRSEKGELARQRILEASRRLIAQGGLASLSHRAVAQEAGVQLAMVSYYFGSLDGLIEATFDAYVERTQPYRDALAQGAQALCIQHLSQERSPSTLRACAEGLADLVTEYILTEFTERRSELELECHFLFELNAPDSLSNKVEELNQNLIQMVASFCTELGSPAPLLDAQLVVAAIHFYEFSDVAARRRLDREGIRSSLLRLFAGICMAEAH